LWEKYLHPHFVYITITSEKPVALLFQTIIGFLEQIQHQESKVIVFTGIQI